MSITKLIYYGVSIGKYRVSTELKGYSILSLVDVKNIQMTNEAGNSDFQLGNREKPDKNKFYKLQKHATNECMLTLQYELYFFDLTVRKVEMKYSFAFLERVARHSPQRLV